MKNIRMFSMMVAVLLIAAASAHAQSGCLDSPEAPTDILLLVGAVGIFHGSRLAQKFRKRG
jgi:XrtJ-associated TM-motif-TM protein